jgi:DNA-binding MarR family transcriptional regulator
MPNVPSNTESRPFAKWGNAATAGWQALPDVLLKNQYKLKISTTELVVLINVLSFWWYAEKLPYPRVSNLAKRMNVTPRTVQRCIQGLIEKGLLAKKEDVGDDGQLREVLDPGGLVAALQTLAIEDPLTRLRLLEGKVAAEIPF